MGLDVDTLYGSYPVPIPDNASSSAVAHAHSQNGNHGKRRHAVLYRSLSASLSIASARRRRGGSRPHLIMEDDGGELLHDLNLSCLQLGVMDMCQKLESHLREVHVSEVLPAAHDLMFVNVTTLEGQAYCLERTHRGWRICSLKHDSMHGDVTHLDLHVLYFNDAHDAIAKVSPAYRRVISVGSQDSGNSEDRVLQFGDFDESGFKGKQDEEGDEEVGSLVSGEGSSVDV